MTQFVRFPGTSGNYTDTPDTNIIDADTANLAQPAVGDPTPGEWSVSGGTGDTIADGQFFGSKYVRGTWTAGDLELRIGDPTGIIPVTVGQTYSYSVKMRKSVAADVIFIFRYYNSGGGGVGITTPYTDTGSVDEWREVSMTDAIAPAQSAFLRIDTRIEGLATAETLDMAEACLVESGTPVSFVPSLRIVGDFDIETKCELPDPDSAGHSQGGVGTWAYNSGGYGLRFISASTVNQVGIATATDAPSNSYVTASYASLGVAVGEIRTIRFTNDTGVESKFYVDGDPVVTAGAATAPGPLGNDLWVGRAPSGGAGDTHEGDIYYATVRDGIDGPIVAVFDPADVGGALP